MWQSRMAAVGMVAACYAPTFPEHAPCDEQHPCPSTLICDPVTQTCVRDPSRDPPPDGPPVDTQCAAGYRLERDTCVDLDECTLGTDDCSTDAACANQPGGFSCTCNPGFSGDGLTCTRVCSSVLFLGDCPLSGTGCASIPQTAIITDAAVGFGLEVKNGGIDNEPAFRTLFDGGGFQLLIVDYSRTGLDADTATRVATWVNAGGRAIVTFWDLDNDTTGATLRTALGVDTVGNYSTPRSVYVDPIAPVNLFGTIETVTSPMTFTNVMADDGDELALVGAGNIVARHTSPAGTGAIAITRVDRAITLGFLSLEATRDADSDGNPDVTELYTNMIGFLCGY